MSENEIMMFDFYGTMFEKVLEVQRLKSASFFDAMDDEDDPNLVAYFERLEASLNSPRITNDQTSTRI